MIALTSPVVFPYSSSGIELGVRAGIAVPANQPGFLALGSDGTTLRYLKTGTDGTLKVDGSGVTQPVSGTLTVNQGTSPWVVRADGSFVDSNNSSTTPLGIGGTFTGTATDLLSYSQVIINLISDKSGTVTLQFSSNGTNWDHTDTDNFAAATPFIYNFPPYARWFRLIISNTSGQAQTYLRLQTIVKPSPQSVSQVTLDTVPSSFDVASLTKSVLVGKSTAGGGTYVDVKVNPSGTLTADVSGSTGVGVTGTFWQQIQPVSGTVTQNAGTGTFTVAGTVTANVGTTNGLALDATLTGGSQKTKLVDSGGTNVATISVAGALKVDGSAVTQPVSQASLPLPTGAATETTLGGVLTTTAFQARVPVNGQALMAASVPVVIASNQSAVPVSGTFWQTTQPVSGTVTQNAGTGTFAVSGTVTANIGTSGSLALDATLTGGSQKTKLVDTGGTNVASISAAGALKVDGSAVTQPVSGTFWQATQPVSIAATVTVAGNLTNNNAAPAATNIGALVARATAAAPTYTEGNQALLSTDLTGALRITGSISATNPSVGTVGSASPTSGTMIAGTDGTTLRAPIVMNSNPAGTEYGLVVRMAGGASGGTSSNFAAAFPSSGTAIGVKDSTATNMTFLKANASNALVVDGSAVTQPVSGTITANIGTSGSLALDATLTGGTQKAIVRGGAKGTTTAADVTSTASGANHQPLDVAIYDASGNQITSFGGGTQYADGQARGTATGTLLMVDDGVNIQSASGDTAGKLNVNATQAGTWNVTNISGTISLPTGAATETTLAKLAIAQGTALGSNTQAMVGGSVTTQAPTYTTGQISPLSLTTQGALRVDNSGVTQPVSGTVTANQGGTWNITNVSGTVSLPTGASTETTLSALNGKFGSLGQKAMAGSAPVVIASDQSAVPVTGTLTAVTSITNSVTVIGNKTPADAFANPTDAQDVMAFGMGWNGTTWDRLKSSTANGLQVDVTRVQGSVAVTGTFWQATQPISQASLPLPTGASTETTLAKLAITPGTALGSNTVAMAGGSVTTAAPTYTTGQINPLSLTTAGQLRVDGSGTTQPVSGTFWQATQPVSIAASVTVAQATAANLNATVTGTVAQTQSGTWNITNVSGTVSLPTGASTETTLAKLTLAQGSTTSGQSGTLMQGAVTTQAPTYTTAQTSPLSLTTAGQLRVDASATTQPVSGTISANQAGTWNITNVSGTVSLPTGAQTQANQTTLGNQTTKLNDGTNTAAVKAASTQAVATDPALVVAVSPNNTVATQEANHSGSAVTSPAASGSNSTLLASNASRRGATVFNDGSTVLYLKLGATASLTSYTLQIAVGGYYEVPFGYSGQIDGIWSGSPTGNARVTEIT